MKTTKKKTNRAAKVAPPQPSPELTYEAGKAAGVEQGRKALAEEILHTASRNGVTVANISSLLQWLDGAMWALPAEKARALESVRDVVAELRGMINALGPRNYADWTMAMTAPAADAWQAVKDFALKVSP